MGDVRLTVAVATAGIGSTVTGAALIYLPAAFLVAGALLLAVLFVDLGGPKP